MLPEDPGGFGNNFLIFNPGLLTVREPLLPAVSSIVDYGLFPKKRGERV